MSTSDSEYRQRVALALYTQGDELPPMGRLEALMASKEPPYEKDPLKWNAWVAEACGRYYFAMADKFVAGYEAQRKQWGRD